MNHIQSSRRDVALAVGLAFSARNSFNRRADALADKAA
jgi:hypothetical protein